MKKILVVFTGGTIGSTQEGDTIDLAKTGACHLLEYYCKEYGGDVEFETIQPLNVLSENIGYDDWNTLFNTLLSLPLSEYDGMIITHGSDTLSYTAALTGMVMRHTPIPIVLTAANYTLADSRSNGLRNFKSAVEFIACRIKGVFVIYENTAGEALVYLATRLCESDPYRDAYACFGGVPLGRMERGVFFPVLSPVNPSPRKLNCEFEMLFEEVQLRKKVLLIRQYPGIDYTAFDLERCSAVLLYLYHSATAGTAQGEGNALDFIKRCRAKSIPVYAASFKETGVKTNYATAKELLAHHVVPFINISPEAAYAKLCLAVNAGEETARRLINETVYFESLKDFAHEQKQGSLPAL